MGRVCDSCGALFSTETCPTCHAVVGGLLGKSLGPNRDISEVATRTLSDLKNPWSASPFATGWKRVGLAVKLAIMIGVIAVAVQMYGAIEDQRILSFSQLQSHEKVIKDVTKDVLLTKRAVTREELAEVVNNYNKLYASSSDLVGASTNDASMHVYMLLGLAALLAVSAVAGYRDLRAVNRMRATVAHLQSEDGRKMPEAQRT